MIKAIIFDFDGVLVESVDIKTSAFAQLFKPEGDAVVNAVVDYHLKNGGVSRFEKIRSIYKDILRRTLTDEKFNSLCRKFSRLVVDEVVKAPYVDGAKEFLDKYALKCKYFIASGTPQREIEGIIRRRGMAHYFSAVYGAPESKEAIVKKIISGAHLTADEIIYVGDASSDYEAAAANGIFFVARVSAHTTSFDTAGCAKIKNFRELENTLKIQKALP